MAADIFLLPRYVYLVSIHHDRWNVEAYVLICGLYLCVSYGLFLGLYQVGAPWPFFLAWFLFSQYVFMMFSVLSGILCMKWWRERF